MIAAADLVGVWHRSLLRRPGRPDDRATMVTWVQGPRHFVDLRQERAGDHLLTREGFAGRLELDGDTATWHRELDLTPPTGTPDTGRLTLHPTAVGELPGTTDLLVEDGVHAPYVEHWWRDAGPLGARAVCAGGLDPSTHAPVILARAGDWFGLAHGNEVSLGRVEEHQPRQPHQPHRPHQPSRSTEIWRIERSSQPSRIGAVVQLGALHLDAVCGDQSLLPERRPPS